MARLLGHTIFVSSLVLLDDRAIRARSRKVEKSHAISIDIRGNFSSQWNQGYKLPE